MAHSVRRLAAVFAILSLLVVALPLFATDAAPGPGIDRNGNCRGITYDGDIEGNAVDCIVDGDVEGNCVGSTVTGSVGGSARGCDVGGDIEGKCQGSTYGGFLFGKNQGCRDLDPDNEPT